MGAPNDLTPTMDTQTKVAEPTPPHSASSETPTALPASTTTTTPTPLSPPGSQPKTSTAAEGDDYSPILSPSSTTPVLEKEELDFTGNVDVNDDAPTEKELQRAAKLHLLSAEGESIEFSSLYSGEGRANRVMIIFVRHFFCGNCQEYVRTLCSSITPEDLLSLSVPTSLTIIGCGRPELIPMYASTTNCSFPIYADPTRKIYDYLGMTRTLDLGKKKPEYMQASMFTTTVQSIMQGLGQGRSALKGGDFKQVGGEMLWEEGEVTWCHRMRNTRDHAEISELRRALGLEHAKPPLRKRWSHGIKEPKREKSVKEKKSEKDEKVEKGEGKSSRFRSMSWGRKRSASKGSKAGSQKTSSIREEDEDGKPVLNGSTTAPA